MSPLAKAWRHNEKLPMHFPNHITARTKYRASALILWVVLLTIIGLLLLLAMPTVRRPTDAEAKSEQAVLVVKSAMKLPFATYKLDIGSYPTTMEGLQAFITAPTGKEDKWRGPYIDISYKGMLRDPWSEPYLYLLPGTHNPDGYDLFSKGPDKIAGTADDIGNW
ncbi:MAG: type II secretion system protein GspG [Verrucomicrobiota bacterium]